MALFVAGGLLLPREVHVERTIEIQRPVNTVFTLLNRFDSFPAWSPWNDRDPAVQFRFSGPQSGVGARLEWSGDPRLVGTGWMQITQSSPNSLIRTHLVLEQQGVADTAFLIDRIAGGARVTWTFDTDLVEGHGLFGGLISRYFGLFFDRWIGSDFETGLTGLKSFAESLPAGDFSGLEVQLIDVAPTDVLFIPGRRNGSSAAVAEGLAHAYGEISTFMALNGLERTGQPMAITRSWDDRDYRVDAAIPVKQEDIPTTGNVRWGQSPSGRAARVVHHGSYDDLASSYEKLAAYMAAHGLGEGQVSWEHYISDPGETPVDERVTHIYFLLEPSS
jgi:effector-binding domain-containing protein